MKHYDLIVLGGGPAGYIAAERAAALGKTVLLAEKKAIGGTCLNEGCIPTKSLLYGAKIYTQARNSASLGVTARDVTFDLAVAMKHKASVIATLQKGILGQLKRLGVDLRTGQGTFLRPGLVSIEGEEIGGTFILLAQGSSSARPPIPGSRDNPRVVTSREILEIQKQPERLAVIGGGYIGMEFAAFFASIGTDVTVIEMMPEIIPSLEPEMARNLRKHLPEISFRTGYRVDRIQDETIHISPVADDRSGPAAEPETIQADLILLSTGRVSRAVEEGLGSAGVALHQGCVVVDEYLQTNLPGVYAAGDITGKMLLAHAAYRMGEVAVSHMFREDSLSKEATSAAGRQNWPNRMRFDTIPWVVFTSPEVAGCGLTAREAEARGYQTRTVTLPLMVSGRYVAEHPREKGTVTVVVNAGDRRLLGVQMLGSGTSEIIHSAAAMIETGWTVENLRKIVFPHPTVSEALRDALWAVPSGAPRDMTSHTAGSQNTAGAKTHRKDTNHA
ncbi:dihydrolipoamide dehydrogenase [Alkalispirochaeta americana]|uniref:Dihydrolipoyl dehydrogenase n=1 Tax=Alkalispirochaeta americana TaxID=159291 RepID=A0A1N6QX88_9SPIO|nr:dihydrolipoyl dehydrogenase [Alkalispirochaeta americana]SIQ21224.1 dihydrolipoamide dehydrogenase [Alkalispirochaeta americana]